MFTAVDLRPLAEAVNNGVFTLAVLWAWLGLLRLVGELWRYR